MNLPGVPKYLSPSRYWRRFIIMANKIVMHHLDMLLAPEYQTPLRYPPVFFLGAPRSGTTLVYQVFTDAFDVAYLSNFHCQFFGAPALAEKIFHPLKRKSCSDYTSNYGQTKGASGPSECGLWWYRFFPSEPAYVTVKDIENFKMRGFRRSLLALTESFNRPVIFKNLYASLRLEPISKYIPEALFIVIKRNEIDNAHSILEGRMKALGRYDLWWSVPLPDIEKLKLMEPAQQVIEQINGIYTLIDNAVKGGSIDKKRILSIRYEDFCNDVGATLKIMERFLEGNNLSLKRRFSVPDKFPINSALRIDNNIYSSLLAVSKKYKFNE